jgi:hypothetical protein
VVYGNVYNAMLTFARSVTTFSMVQTCPHKVAFQWININLVVHCCYLHLLGDGIGPHHGVSPLCVPRGFGGMETVLGVAGTTLRIYLCRNWLRIFWVNGYFVHLNT